MDAAVAQMEAKVAKVAEQLLQTPTAECTDNGVHYPSKSVSLGPNDAE